MPGDLLSIEAGRRSTECATLVSDWGPHFVGGLSSRRLRFGDETEMKVRWR